MKALKIYKGGYKVKYQILKHGMGLPFCVLNGSAGVGKEPDDREKFFGIFQNSKVDYYKCPYAMYIVIGPQYDILLKDLSLFKGDRELYLNTQEGDIVYINRQNFSIRCTRKECVSPDAWVKEYIPRPKKENNKEPKEPQFKLVEIEEREEC